VSDYRGHIAAGAAFYGVLAFVVVVVAPPILGFDSALFATEWWEIPAQLVVAVMAALWPDVDITSQGRKLFYRLFLVLDLYLMLRGEWRAAALLGLVAILPGLGRHRGWTHRLWSALLVPSPIVIVPLFITDAGGIGSNPDFGKLGQGASYYVAALIGYISHLAADGMLGRTIGKAIRAFLWPITAVWRATEEPDHGDL